MLVLGCAAALLLIAGCTGQAKAPTKLVVPSAYTAEKIKPDGKVDEKAWKETAFIKIPTAGGPVVEMKSVHSDDTISFLIRWKDATKSDISKVWEYDGTAWKNGPDQDKLAILWDKGASVAYFEIKGCGAVCHTEDGDKNLWYMATNSRKEKTDLWFWMAGQGNVYGFANDRFLDDTVDPELPKAARKQDQGEVGFLKNGYKTPVEKIAPSRPTKQLIADLTVDTTPYPTAEQMDDIISYRVFKAGDRQPFIYFTGPPDGSQADVFARGVWTDGVWSVELSRKLNTAHKDDMPFALDADEPVYYMFGLIVSDHTEPPPIAHSISPPVSLRLDPK